MIRFILIDGLNLFSVRTGEVPLMAADGQFELHQRPPPATLPGGESQKVHFLCKPGPGSVTI
jgi:hypothetical protein